MALKKKPSKRSSSKPNTSVASSQIPHSDYKKKPVFISFVMLFVVTAIMGISLIMWSSVASAVHSPKFYAIQVVNEFPHDHEAFTQGLHYVGDGPDGTLFESTGLYGKSSVRRVALRTGKVEVLHNMDSSYFGEGLTLLGERLFQLTWQTQIGFIYDEHNLSKIEKFTHQMQDGWGLATDGKVLFGTDGTSTLYQLDRQTLKVVGKHVVKYNDHEVRYLNELEFVNGEVWANIWQTDCIARISREDGTVLGWILLQNLRKKLIAAGFNNIDVLNGIAWDSKNDRIFVTGKLWPKLYEIKLHPINKHPSDEDIKQLCIP